MQEMYISGRFLIKFGRIFIDFINEMKSKGLLWEGLNQKLTTCEVKDSKRIISLQ